jgi:putative DNA primase/helicase
VAPDGRIPCPTWDRFIRAVFLEDEEMVAFMQRLLGYFLTGDRSEQKVFFWYGLGANGKSTLADLVHWLLGSYAIKLPAAVLMQTNVERHPTELAQLRGKRLAISSELDEGQFWAESRIKELTGDEVLTARYMRGDFFEFRMTQTHLIVGNYKPRLRGGDAAMARRFVLVPFLAKQIPEKVSAASREYMADNDDVALWLAECCVTDPRARAKASDLYESFANWIKLRGQHVPSMRLWGDRMAAINGLAKVHSNGIRYAGVRLNEDETDRQTNMSLQSVRR